MLHRLKTTVVVLFNLFLVTYHGHNYPNNSDRNFPFWLENITELMNNFLNLNYQITTTQWLIPSSLEAILIRQGIRDKKWSLIQSLPYSQSVLGPTT